MKEYGLGMGDGDNEYDTPGDSTPQFTDRSTPDPDGGPSDRSGYEPTDVTPEPDDVGEQGRPWWGEPWSEPDPDTAHPVAASTVSAETIEPPAMPPGPPARAFDSPLGPTRGERHPMLRQPLLVVAVAVGIVFFTAVGAAVGVTVGKGRSDRDVGLAINKAGRVATAPAVDASGATNVESVAAAVLPTVVSIEERTATLQGTGSGVILDSTHGLILTNNHVVSAAAGGTGRITVTLNDGRAATAAVRGRDPSSDIAVVQVHLDNLTAATLGDSSTLKVGQTVVAFGSPLGLRGSVTAGIVSALDRPVSTQDSTGQSLSGTGDQSTIDAIQTDAAINPGNSGGPLVDGAGHVIGINSAIASTGGSAGTGAEAGSIGVGFAIPINEALDTAEQIIRTGHAVHPVIDASVSSTTDGSNGALVRQVGAGGPAQQGGLRVGDVIVAVDGKPVATPDALIVALRKDHQPGDAITLTYVRDGKTEQATVTLGASSPSP